MPALSFLKRIDLPQRLRRPALYYLARQGSRTDYRTPGVLQAAGSLGKASCPVRTWLRGRPSRRPFYLKAQDAEAFPRD